jgi:hypothetical protein
MTYAGYEPLDKNEALNFGDLTGQLAAAVGGIGARRQAKRDALDKSASDLKSVMDSWETTKTQDVNEFVLKGANQGREYITRLNADLKAGKISERDYKERITNLNSGWTAMANSAKTYDAQTQEMLKRQASGDAGSVEAKLLELYGDYSDLGNKQFIIGDNGTVGIGTLNPDGTVREFRDARSMSVPGNMIANSVKLVELADKSTENVKVWITNQVNPDGTKMSVEDARDNPSYHKYLADQAEAIAGDHDPKAQASILTDNGGGHFIVSSEKELLDRVEAEVVSENEARIAAGMPAMSESELKKYRTEMTSKGIFMKMDSSGQYVPQLSPEQRKKAKEIVKSAIEVNLGRKESSVEETTLSRERAKKAGKYAPRRGGSGNGGTTPAPSYAAYVSVKDAWDTGNTDELNNMNPNYTFKKDGNVMKVYKNYKNSSGKMVPEGYPSKPFSVATKARELADLFYKDTSKKTAQQQYDDEQALWMNEFGDPATTYSDGTPKSGAPTKPKFN